MPKEQQFKRLYPRRGVSLPCRLEWQGHKVSCTTLGLSYGGISVLLPPGAEPMWGEVVIFFDDGIVLRARPVHVRRGAGSYQVGFKVEVIEAGEQNWKELCYLPHW